MDRIEQLLRGVDLLTSKGMEIGALDKPVIPPSTPRVFYVDFLDTESLRKRYKDDPHVDIGKIVRVGGVWGENTLAEIASSAMPFDYIVASHVIEHVPNLVGWLQELGSVLTSNGQIRLAVPDRRYTFDFLRRETVLEDVLAAHVSGARVPQPRQVLDFTLNMVSVDCGEAWTGCLDVAELKNQYSVDQSLGLAGEAHRGVYHDVHCWVFTPYSFAGLMKNLAQCGLNQFKCAAFFDTWPMTFEFFIALEKSDNQTEVVLSWEDMLQRLSKDKLAALPGRTQVAHERSDLTHAATNDLSCITKDIEMIKSTLAGLAEKVQILEKGLPGK